ncbi:MAG: hypothetical protein CMH53_09590 [Myxococcales bacterium]|nr:hypothetical protein [Myxococcales bacterium]
MAQPKVRLCALAVVLLAMVPASLSAHQIGTKKRIGLGIASGNLINGFSPKYYFRRNLAVQANLGVWGQFDAVGASVDVLYTLPFRPALGSLGRLQFNLGGGAMFYLKNGEANIPAVNLAAELGLHLRGLPIEVIFGWRPQYRFGIQTGDTPVGLGGALRFYL